MSKSTKSKEFESLTQNVSRPTAKTDKIGDKVTRLDESVEEYTEKELKYLDRYKEITGDAMDDDELYDIIIKYNFDDNKIRKEVEEHMKLVKKKGEEYGWTKIEKGKKAKPEKKEPEVKVKQRSNKYKNYQDKANRYRAQNKQNEQEGEVEQIEGGDYYDNYQNYDNYNQYNNYNQYRGYNNYGYGNRGRGYGRGRGSSKRGGRGRSQRYNNNYYSTVDALFEQQLNLGKEEPLKEIGIENQESEDKIKEIKEETNEEEEKIHHRDLAPTSPIKSTHKSSHHQESSHRPQSSHTQQHHTQQHHQQVPTQNAYAIHKQHSSEDETNIFNSKDIPSNIRSNIKDLIEDESNVPSYQKSFGNIQKQNEHNFGLHHEQKQQKKSYDEFSVSSHSMSIGNKDVKPSGTAKINQSQPNQPTTTSSISYSQNFSQTPQQTTNKKPTQNQPTPTTSKKKETPMGGQEMPQGYMPWPMGPMGFYMPQNMQGMNYDPSTVGSNPMYQMMPMYYMPYMQQQGEVEENMGKGKKSGFTGQPNFQNQGGSDMNQQQNPMMPQFAPMYYYGSQNPYTPMGFPGMMGNFMANPNAEGAFPHQMGYDMKNMNVKNSNSNEENSQGFYGGYSGFGGYKQG